MADAAAVVGVVVVVVVVVHVIVIVVGNNYSQLPDGDEDHFGHLLRPMPRQKQQQKRMKIGIYWRQ